ncbi:MAG TPA: DGQHR domain-containing protein [Candidatus Atribacteria bacterium]|nr:DGQHR domain-containing protein [Candidatus Atribacteria bacterium]
MKREYSANNLLRIFAQNLGFKVYIFDDPQIGPEIKLIEKSKKGEIDAVMLYKNIVCLVSITKGYSRNLEKKIERFFEKLDKIASVDDIKLEIKLSSKKQISEKIDIAEKMLKEINEHIENIQKEYNHILVKLFFCPNKQLDEEFVNKKRKNYEFIIDKDIFEYFQEVLLRLDKRFLFNDFMHFLGIKKVDLEKKGTSKTKKPARTSPFKVDRLELERDKIIMYSLSLRVEDIVDYVTVLRMARKYDKKGFQRMVKATRLKKINEEYLSKNETFPNNIIIGLNPEIYTKEEEFYDNENEEITFFDEFNSLIIIDGQHRFFSFVKGNKLNRSILVTLIFFRGEDKEENYLLMDKMFYKINKTQERIDPNLSFILKARIDPESEENFWYTVFKKLDKRGFFANRFSFKETTMKKTPQKSIISVITYGSVLRLNKTCKIKGIQVDGLETFYSENKNDNINFAYNLLKNYFDVIEKTLHAQRLNKNDLTPREIGALLRLIRHFILCDKEKVRKMGEIKDITKFKNKEHKTTIKYFEKILELIPFKKVIELEYPTSNWAAVEGYMLKKIHKYKPSFGNKALLSKKGLEVYDNV